MNCLDIRGLIHCELDGDPVDERCRTALEDHLAQCDQCARFHASCSSLTQSLARFEEADLPAQFSAEVMARVRALDGDRARAGRWWARSWVQAGMGSIALYAMAALVGFVVTQAILEGAGSVVPALVRSGCAVSALAAPTLSLWADTARAYGTPVLLLLAANVLLITGAAWAMRRVLLPASAATSNGTQSA